MFTGPTTVKLSHVSFDGIWVLDEDFTTGFCARNFMCSVNCVDMPLQTDSLQLLGTVGANSLGRWFGLGYKAQVLMTR